MAAFIDRIDEIATLENEYARDAASFVVIYGRRRVGKTTLINHFCKNKDAIYFLATEENEFENRNAFKNLVAETFDNTLLANAIFDSWAPIFNIIADESKKGRIVLVIDEFQNLGKANKAFPSVMQKIWDEILKRQVRIMKKRREEMGFTQTDIAEEAGITLQQYQNFEYGKRKIANSSTILALRICAALELDSYELVFENRRDFIKRIRDGMK